MVTAILVFLFLLVVSFDFDMDVFSGKLLGYTYSVVSYFMFLLVELVTLELVQKDIKEKHTGRLTF